jgi:hypothetical protein
VQLVTAIQTLIDHAAGDDAPPEVLEAVAALKHIHQGISGATLQDDTAPFASFAAAQAEFKQHRPDDVSAWICYSAQEEALDIWESHVAEGWPLPHLARTDLAPAIGQLLVWHDRLLG